MPSESSQPAKALSFPLLSILWLHFFWCLIPSWDADGYYSYGWLVAPAAFFFGWRRLGMLRDDLQAPLPLRAAWPPILILIAYMLVMMPLRMVEIGDPSWRPPLWLHAMMLVGLSHFIVAWKLDWKSSIFFIPVTIYALSAVPYPWQIEQTLIRQLTGGVIQIAGELFNLFGRPVTVIGEKLESMGTMVEVTDGCSGIRSFQNLIMAALFFGELFQLRLLPRILLILIGIVASVVMNTFRAMTLARIRFDEGEAAFDSAHDQVGYLAFGLSALVLLIAAKLFAEKIGKRRIVRRTTIKA